MEAGVEGPRAVGVLGGTFNPPHLGHLRLATHARDELGLELVTLMVANVAPHKSGEQDVDPGSSERVAMCRALAEGSEGISVCELELKRPAPSYTVDTFRALREGHP